MTGEPVLERIRHGAEDVLALARLTAHLGLGARQRVTVASARAATLRRLEGRSHRLVALASRLIFDCPTSPYLALLRHVGCEQGDFQGLIDREGVEGALKTLTRRGVYVTYDEFKGGRRSCAAASVWPSSRRRSTTRSCSPT